MVWWGVAGFWYFAEVVGDGGYQLPHIPRYADRAVTLTLD